MYRSRKRRRIRTPTPPPVFHTTERIPQQQSNISSRDQSPKIDTTRLLQLQFAAYILANPPTNLPLKARRDIPVKLPSMARIQDRTISGILRFASTDKSTEETIIHLASILLDGLGAFCPIKRHSRISAFDSRWVNPWRGEEIRERYFNSMKIGELRNMVTESSSSASLFDQQDNLIREFLRFRKKKKVVKELSFLYRWGKFSFDGHFEQLRVSCEEKLEGALEVMRTSGIDGGFWLSGVKVSGDVLGLILKFSGYDYRMSISVGLVNWLFYAFVLSTWKGAVVVTKNNAREIPRIVYESAVAMTIGINDEWVNEQLQSNLRLEKLILRAECSLESTFLSLRELDAAKIDVGPLRYFAPNLDSLRSPSCPSSCLGLRLRSLSTTFQIFQQLDSSCTEILADLEITVSQEVLPSELTSLATLFQQLSSFSVTFDNKGFKFDTTSIVELIRTTGFRRLTKLEINQTFDDESNDTGQLLDQNLVAAQLFPYVRELHFGMKFSLKIQLSICWPILGRLTHLTLSVQTASFVFWPRLKHRAHLDGILGMMPSLQSLRIVAQAAWLKIRDHAQVVHIFFTIFSKPYLTKPYEDIKGDSWVIQHFLQKFCLPTIKELRISYEYSKWHNPTIRAKCFTGISRMMGCESQQVCRGKWKSKYRHVRDTFLWKRPV